MCRQVELVNPVLSFSVEVMPERFPLLQVVNGFQHLESNFLMIFYPTIEFFISFFFWKICLLQFFG